MEHFTLHNTAFVDKITQSDCTTITSVLDNPQSTCCSCRNPKLPKQPDWWSSPKRWALIHKSASSSLSLLCQKPVLKQTYWIIKLLNISTNVSVAHNCEVCSYLRIICAERFQHHVVVWFPCFFIMSVDLSHSWWSLWETVTFERKLYVKRTVNNKTMNAQSLVLSCQSNILLHLPAQTMCLWWPITK